MNDTEEISFDVSPRQSQILTDAQAAVTGLSDLIEETKEDLATLNTEVISAQLADKEVQDLMVPPEDSETPKPATVAAVDWDHVTQELRAVSEELKAIAGGSGDAIVVVGNSPDDQKRFLESVKPADPTDEKSVIDGLLASLRNTDEQQECAFRIRAAKHEEVGTDETPIFGLTIPDNYDAASWDSSRVTAEHGNWPTLIPFIDDAEDNDGEKVKKVTLWTVDDGRFTRLEKTKLMKRAWEGSRLEYRAYACLARAMKAAETVVTSIDSYKEVIDDRAEHCAVLDRNNKNTIKLKQQSEKTKSNQRKDEAKKLLTEMKRASKELAKLDFGNDFTEFPQKPQKILSKKRVETTKQGKLSAWLDPDYKGDKLTDSQKERLNNGGGHSLADGFETEVSESFKIRLKNHTDTIENRVSELIEEQHINLPASVSSDKSYVKAAALDFTAIREKHQKELDTALKAIRIDKGPKGWWKRFVASLLQTVSKVKSVPLMLVGMLTVLSPFLIYHFKPPKNDVKKLLDGLTSGLYEGDQIFVTMGLALVTIILFFVFAHRQNTQAYYKDVKKGRDSAQKLYVKQMKAAVTEAYAHYLQYLGESLSAWKRSPEALQDYLAENTRNPSETELEKLKRKSTILSGWKKELGVRKKECDELGKRWKAAIKNAEKPANHCGVFQ